MHNHNGCTPFDSVRVPVVMQRHGQRNHLIEVHAASDQAAVMSSHQLLLLRMSCTVIQLKKSILNTLNHCVFANCASTHPIFSHNSMRNIEHFWSQSRKIVFLVAKFPIHISKKVYKADYFMTLTPTTYSHPSRSESEAICCRAEGAVTVVQGVTDNFFNADKLWD